MSGDVAVLTDAQRQLLKGALNCLVPPVDDLPGAGDLDLGSQIERALADDPQLRRLFLDGLTAMDLAVFRLADHGFAEAGAAEQVAALRAVETAQPVFFDHLVSQTYRHYYVVPRVLARLGLPVEAPQPNGFTLPPFDPALLDNVRARGPVYRRVERAPR